MADSVDLQRLRPLERRVLDLRAQGLELEEIAARFRKSASFVERVIGWTEIPRSAKRPRRDLTPLESRVLDLRHEGESHAEIGRRFKRGEAYIRQVEGLAHFKEGQRLLGNDG